MNPTHGAAGFHDSIGMTKSFAGFELNAYCRQSSLAPRIRLPKAHACSRAPARVIWCLHAVNKLFVDELLFQQ